MPHVREAYVGRKRRGEAPFLCFIVGIRTKSWEDAKAFPKLLNGPLRNPTSREKQARCGAPRFVGGTPRDVNQALQVLDPEFVVGTGS